MLRVGMERVLIVGAGATGAITASVLKQIGVKTEIVECIKSIKIFIIVMESISNKHLPYYKESCIFENLPFNKGFIDVINYL